MAVVEIPGIGDRARVPVLVARLHVVQAGPSDHGEFGGGTRAVSRSPARRVRPVAAGVTQGAAWLPQVLVEAGRGAVRWRAAGRRQESGLLPAGPQVFR